MESFKIILLSTALSVVYGIVHDQFTTRVCIEYFTIGHPPVFHTQSPALLALGWGVVATWWAGLIIGVPISLACRFGSLPKYTAGQLLPPGLMLMAIMGCASLVAGIVAYLLAINGRLSLTGSLGSEVPPAKHAAFLADLWAHTAAYAFGFLGGLMVCGFVLARRWKLAVGRK